MDNMINSLKAEVAATLEPHKWAMKSAIKETLKAEIQQIVHEAIEEAMTEATEEAIEAVFKNEDLGQSHSMVGEKTLTLNPTASPEIEELRSNCSTTATSTECVHSREKVSLKNLTVVETTILTLPRNI